VVIAWVKQAELLLKKIFFGVHSYLTQLHQTSSDWFLLSSQSCWNFIHLHVLSRKSHDADFCMWSFSECNTKLWMLQLSIRKCTVFWPLGFDFPQLLNKFCLVLSVFFAYFHTNVFQILPKCKYMDIECTDRELNLIKE